MSRITLFLLFISSLFFLQAAGSNEGNGSTKRDTVTARVMYGESLVLEELKNAAPAEIIAYRDSVKKLRAIDPGVLAQLDLLVSIQNMNKFEVADLIDSLFEMTIIPYALINQINHYLDHNPPKDIREEELPDKFIVNLCQSQFPADTFYKDWNTLIPHPYQHSLSQKDTSIELLLQGVLKNDEFVFPIERNVMTSSFGWREGQMHSGVDLDLEVWDPVVSVFPGVVRVARYYGGYGRVVVVRHYNGLETLYAHLHRFKVEPGEKVEAGQVIGLGGSSGRSSGSHLHFEVRFKGIALNPAHLIDFKDEKVIDPQVTLKKIKYGYAAIPEGVEYHVVKKGDNLYEIARRYGTTINRLCNLNGIRRNQILWVGQKIRIG